MSLTPDNVGPLDQSLSSYSPWFPAPSLFDPSTPLYLPYPAAAAAAAFAQLYQNSIGFPLDLSTSANSQSSLDLTGFHGHNVSQQEQLSTINDSYGSPSPVLLEYDNSDAQGLQFLSQDSQSGTTQANEAAELDAQSVLSIESQVPSAVLNSPILQPDTGVSVRFTNIPQSQAQAYYTSEQTVNGIDTSSEEQDENETAVAKNNFPANSCLNDFRAMFSPFSSPFQSVVASHRAPTYPDPEPLAPTPPALATTPVAPPSTPVPSACFLRMDDVGNTYLTPSPSPPPTVEVVHVDGNEDSGFGSCGSTTSMPADSSAMLLIDFPGAPGSGPHTGTVSAPSSAAAQMQAVSSKQFVACKVCGDKASGYHYGVTSCEGCKGFFRRSIQKQIEYRCLREGKCVVYRLNRNRCQYCRFKKCLAVGMSRDSVRYGRVPKQRKAAEQAQQQSGAITPVGCLEVHDPSSAERDNRVSSMSGGSDGCEDTELEKRQLAIYDVILQVSQAHHSFCDYTEDKIKNLQQRPILVDDRQFSAHCDSLEQQRLSLYAATALHVTPEMGRVVEFAKRIPNFGELSQTDQLTLIKQGFFEIWLCRTARMFHPHSGTLTFADGQFLTRDQLELIYSPELVNLMFSFAAGFNSLHLNDGEIALFTAVVLLSERPDLQDVSTVFTIQKRLVEALKMQLSRSHSADPNIFTMLRLKVTELLTLAEKHREVLRWYRINWSRLTPVPLFAEIYEIPKNSEEASAAGLYIANGSAVPAPPPLVQMNSYASQPAEHSPVELYHHHAVTNGLFLNGNGGTELDQHTNGLMMVGH